MRETIDLADYFEDALLRQELKMHQTYLRDCGLDTEVVHGNQPLRDLHNVAHNVWVECKADYNAHGTGNLCLELFSNIEDIPIGIEPYVEKHVRTRTDADGEFMGVDVAIARQMVDWMLTLPASKRAVGVPGKSEPRHLLSLLPVGGDPMVCLLSDVHKTTHRCLRQGLGTYWVQHSGRKNGANSWYTINYVFPSGELEKVRLDTHRNWVADFLANGRKD